jgi:hypothetical protein
MDPKLEVLTNYRIDNVHQPLLRNFRDFFQAWEILKGLRNAKNVIHYVRQFETLILWHKQVPYFVAWNEVFLARDQVFHVVLNSKESRIRMRTPKKRKVAYHGDRLIGW